MIVVVFILTLLFPANLNALSAILRFGRYPKIVYIFAFSIGWFLSILSNAMCYFYALCDLYDL